MTYTHKDEAGVLWRFEGGRPISEIADRVMAGMYELQELPSEDELRDVMDPFYVAPTIRLHTVRVTEVKPAIPVPEADELK